MDRPNASPASAIGTNLGYPPPRNGFSAMLFATVWPGIVVEENTLQVHISALRKALDSGMITTVHGRGYKYAGSATY